MTPTEAGATAVIVCIVLGFVLGTLKFSDFSKMLVGSAKVNGVILPIIAFSLPLAQALAIMGVPQGFVASVSVLTDDPYADIANDWYIDPCRLCDGNDTEHRYPCAYT